MKQGRFSNEQIFQALRETDRARVAVVAKLHEVNKATIYRCHKKFGQSDTDELKRLNVLDAENARPEQVHYPVQRGLAAGICAEEGGALGCIAICECLSRTRR